VNNVVDITTLEGMIQSRGIPDEKVETAFKSLIDEGFYLDDAIANVLELLEKYRPEVFKKINRENLAKQLNKK
jgi:hypothetical protein